MSWPRAVYPLENAMQRSENGVAPSGQSGIAHASPSDLADLAIVVVSTNEGHWLQRCLQQPSIARGAPPST